MHVAMNIWIFSNPSIFPTELLETTPENGIVYYYFPTYSFTERVFSVNGMPFFILLCAAFVALFMCSPVLTSLAYACFFSASTKRGGMKRKIPFTLEKQTISKLGLNSYDMVNHPRYRGAMLELDKKEDMDKADEQLQFMNLENIVIHGDPALQAQKNQLSSNYNNPDEQEQLMEDNTNYDKGDHSGNNSNPNPQFK